MPLQWHNQIWQSLEEGAGKRCSECESESDSESMQSWSIWCCWVSESVSQHQSLTCLVELGLGVGLRVQNINTLLIIVAPCTSCSVLIQVIDYTSIDQLHLFASGLETLPTELMRNFNLMKDLDKRTQGKVTNKSMNKIKLALSK